jgi:hypothetical protein
MSELDDMVEKYSGRGGLTTLIQEKITEKRLEYATVEDVLEDIEAGDPNITLRDIIQTIDTTLDRIDASCRTAKLPHVELYRVSERQEKYDEDIHDVYLYEREHYYALADTREDEHALCEMEASDPPYTKVRLITKFSRHEFGDIARAVCRFYDRNRRDYAETLPEE